MKWMPKYMVIGLLICQVSNAHAYDPCEDHDVNHKPRADVEYQPDYKIDNGFEIIPERVRIPITVDLAERFDINTPLGADFDTNFGFIEIDEQGGIFYNGEDISGDIKDKCENDSERSKATKSEETKNGDNTDTERKLP